MTARGRRLTLQEAERQRIARELHDEVGQTLTGVMLQVEGLAAQIPDELRDQLEELRETARHGAEEVRRIARRLRPDALEELGLHSALAALATRVRTPRAGPGRAPAGAGVAVSPEEELVIYRVAQEALTNVARHAERLARAVELRQRADTTLLLVATTAAACRRAPAPRKASGACASVRCSSVPHCRSSSRPGGGTACGCPSPRRSR